MPDGVATSNQHSGWLAREKDIKSYLHFDRYLSTVELEAIANNPEAVATNRFYPLLRFNEEWTKYREDGEKLRRKSRPLRYSARRDAAIYARYRALLADLYETELRRLEIEEVPIAYRRIPSETGNHNKSNIDFAKDAFEAVRNIGECVVSVVDIKSYFESLDHTQIRDCWERMLGHSMPPDHHAVFKSVTSYSVVDVDHVWRRLSLFDKVGAGNRSERRQRKIDALRKARHKQICSPAEFRNLICGGDKKYPSLIQRNSNNFGIPQGTPISDVIANFYLIEFDKEVSNHIGNLGGYYRRYSDDIICIVPTSKAGGSLDIKDYLQDKIREFGSQLQIQDKKVVVGRFDTSSGRQKFTHVFPVGVKKNGLEYLGFEFDGMVVKIRNSTLSNAWRKLKRHAYGYSRRFIRQYRAKGDVWLRDNFPIKWLEKKLLMDASYSQDIGYESWTFVKYTKRAGQIFRDFDRTFASQTKRYRYLANKTIWSCFEKALKRHGKTAMLKKGRRF